MKTDALLRQTRIHFPRFEKAEVEITPIEKGGSDRKFYRVRCSAEQTIILVKYNFEREENRHYATIAEFLSAHEIRAPKIYFHDASEGLIWLEDLGERDLFSYRGESWRERRALYENALEEIVKLHQLPEKTCIEMREHLPAEFNAALYLWEQNYFFENCLGRYFKLAQDKLEKLIALPKLKKIAHDLADRPRVLVHRDFQSQNIIVRDGQTYLIDFQGMRPGLAEYDLASLIYDPYVDLSETERGELIACYCAIRQKNNFAVTSDFDETLQLCAMQRLMQAIGFYTFIGTVKGRRSFFKFIPAALNSLRLIVHDISGLDPLDRALSDLGA